MADENGSGRAQWLRAAVLGANDGLVSTAALMMGVGAVKADPKAMLLSGIAGLIGGALSMAIGEFVSVYSQYDIELAEFQRKLQSRDISVDKLPSPVKSAVASGLAFSVGAAIPLLAAGFIYKYQMRMGIVAATVTMALIVFGWLGAWLGRAPVMRSCARMLGGGWIAMAVTFGLMKIFRSQGF